MHTLLRRVEGDMAMNLSSLQFLKLDPSVRSRAAEALVPVSKMKVRFFPVFSSRLGLRIGVQDMLYIVLIAAGRVITLVRPKKHSIHPSGIPSLLPSGENTAEILRR